MVYDPPPETREAILAPILALCEARGWRWSWLTRQKGDRWRAEVKVEELGDFGWATVACFASSGLGDELSSLRPAARYVLEHIARRDRQVEKYEDYKRRVAAGAPPI